MNTKKVTPLNRRSFLKRSAVTAVLGFFSNWLHSPFATAQETSKKLFRRMRPGDPEWPNQQAWDDLARKVDGRLVSAELPYQVCIDQPQSSACARRLEELKNPFFIQEQPGGTQSTGWLNGWEARPSVHAVAAKTPQDVAEAVKFANKHRLRLVIKGGAHEYLGRSNSADSLMVWTRGMDGLELHDGFVPTGAPEGAKPTPAITVEAGAIWLQAYDKVTTQAGRVVLGGGCTTVGVAGHVQQGGYGSFSKRWGTSAQNLLQAEVVTADGSIRTINAYRDPDLFWALKGGGAGTFCAVTKFTLRTHEMPQWVGVFSVEFKARNDRAYRRLIEEFLGFARAHLLTPHWGESVAFVPGRSIQVRMLSQGLDSEQMSEVWAPLLAWANDPANQIETVDGLRQSFPFRDLWNANVLPEMRQRDPRPGAPSINYSWATNAVENQAYWADFQSLWLPESLLRKDQIAALAQAVLDGSQHHRCEFHFNKGLAGAPEEVRRTLRETTAIPVAASEAFCLLQIASNMANVRPGVKGHEPDPAVLRQRADAVNRAYAPFRALVSEPRSYQAQMSYHEPNWREVCWGEHYEKLLRIKRRHDPDNLFFGHHCVGSENWSPDGFEQLS